MLDYFATSGPIWLKGAGCPGRTTAPTGGGSSFYSLWATLGGGAQPPFCGGERLPRGCWRPADVFAAAGAVLRPFAR